MSVIDLPSQQAVPWSAVATEDFSNGGSSRLTSGLCGACADERECLFPSDDVSLRVGTVQGRACLMTSAVYDQRCV